MLKYRILCERLIFNPIKSYKNGKIMTEQIDDTSWRQEYLEMKAGLSKLQISLLKDGPHSLSQSWLLGAMRGDWKRMKGIKDPEPPDCQSSLSEFFKKQDSYESGTNTGKVES